MVQGRGPWVGKQRARAGSRLWAEVPLHQKTYDNNAGKSNHNNRYSCLSSARHCASTLQKGLTQSFLPPTLLLVKLRQDDVKSLAPGHMDGVGAGGGGGGELGLEPGPVLPRVSALNHRAVLQHERGDSPVGPWGPKPSLRVSAIPRHNLPQEEGSTPEASSPGGRG